MNNIDYISLNNLARYKNFNLAESREFKNGANQQNKIEELHNPRFKISIY